VLSLINFINSTFIKMNGFIGFVNLFGTWTGDIGEESAFITPTPTPEVQEEIQQEVSINTTDQQKEDGGALSVKQTNNVGEYVLPGDTVTFFVNTKNVGTGKVYDAKLVLFLIYEGEYAGGKTFYLGDIQAGKVVKVNTGFVLSKNAPAGDYIARALVTGTTGPDNTKLQAVSDSTFSIFGNNVATNVATPQGSEGPTQPAVLGVTNKEREESGNKLLLLLLLSLGGYLIIKTIRNAKDIRLAWENSTDFKQRLMAVRMFLL
jgi:hypothetical protein